MGHRSYSVFQLQRAYTTFSLGVDRITLFSCHDQCFRVVPGPSNCFSSLVRVIPVLGRQNALPLPTCIISIPVGTFSSFASQPRYIFYCSSHQECRALTCRPKKGRVVCDVLYHILLGVVRIETNVKAFSKESNATIQQGQPNPNPRNTCET